LIHLRFARRGLGLLSTVVGDGSDFSAAAAFCVENGRPVGGHRFKTSGTGPVIKGIVGQGVIEYMVISHVEEARLYGPQWTVLGKWGFVERGVVWLTRGAGSQL